MAEKRQGGRVLPGFGLSMGITLTYLGLIILLPLSTIFLKTATLSWEGLWKTLSDPRTVSAYSLSLRTAFVAALVNGVFGLLVAWVLERYSFPGKRLVDGMIDLPFALPTAVAGIVLTTFYAPTGWAGQLFAPLGVKIAYTELGITIALIFIGLPFVVRTIQPILRGLEPQIEGAAASLGAGPFETFWRVILPELLPGLLTGTTLAFARGLGEYGSVIFIAGNMPGKTEVTPLLIMIQLEQYNYAGAAAIALGFLLISFTLLLVVNALSAWTSRPVARA
jgi:sulfate/thiosulfate transport system permease protein